MHRLKRKYLWMIPAAAVLLSLAGNAVLLSSRYRQLVSSYESRTLQWDSSGGAEGYSGVYVSPLGLYGKLKVGLMSRHLNGTEVYGTEGCSALRSVFSWYRDFRYAGYAGEMQDLFYRAMIRSVYQYILPEDLESDAFRSYAESLSSAGISLYVIYDEQDMDADDFESFAAAAASANLGIQGIVADVEPLSSASARNEKTLSTLADFLQACSSSAHALGLKLLPCIPVWYDDLSEEDTERIIAASDRIILMNYAKSGMIENIQTEMSIASQDGIAADSAVELSDLDEEAGVTASISFAEDGFEAAETALMQVYQAYPEADFCYHHLRSLYAMMEQSYIAEIPSDVQLYIDGIDSAWLDGVTRFYGLAFDQEYEVTDDQGKSVTSFTASRSDTDNGWLTLSAVE